MNEDFVPFEIAKKLKEKGFPQHITEDAYIVENYGEDEYEIGERLPIPLIPDYMDDVAAPTISQVLKWLREKKGWNIIVKIDKIDGWYYVLQDMKGECYVTSDNDCFSSYELAAIAGIEYIIDNNLI